MQQRSPAHRHSPSYLAALEAMDEHMYALNSESATSRNDRTSRIRARTVLWFISAKTSSRARLRIDMSGSCAVHVQCQHAATHSQEHATTQRWAQCPYLQTVDNGAAVSLNGLRLGVDALEQRVERNVAAV